jgi:hypothetical protein
MRKKPLSSASKLVETYVEHPKTLAELRAVVLSQAPETDGVFFKVPKVIER